MILLNVLGKNLSLSIEDILVPFQLAVPISNFVILSSSKSCLVNLKNFARHYLPRWSVCQQTFGSEDTSAQWMSIWTPFAVSISSFWLLTSPNPASWLSNNFWRNPRDFYLPGDLNLIDTRLSSQLRCLVQVLETFFCFFLSIPLLTWMIDELYLSFWYVLCFLRVANSRRVYCVDQFSLSVCVLL